MKRRIVCLLLAVVMLIGTVSVLGSCKKDEKNDVFVIMSEELDGIFNPFFSTTGADATIVSMTQIGMITTGYENGEVTVAYGDKEATVVLDYKEERDDASDTTKYTFVIKNGLKFSDGEALTIEDVLFNMYVYLDPVYTGSSTMYSTDIVGLTDYRSQTYGADSDVDDSITEDARARAKARMQELITLFRLTDDTPYDGSYDVSYAKMKTAILAHTLGEGYKKALATEDKLDDVTNQQLLEDYEKTLRLFREELEKDYTAAQEAYTEAPYKEHSEFKDPIFNFMCYEGLVNIEYADKVKPDGTIQPGADRSKIVNLDKMYVASTKEEAIEYVYNIKISTALDQILTYWATANELQTEYMAKAREIILAEKMDGLVDGQLKVPNISGIVSLGHTTDVESVSITQKDGSVKTYTVASAHNENGTPKNEGEYDVLEITINGVDPKAIWNFAFAVAPQHYYAKGYEVDIANNKFGVEYGSADYMQNVIQSVRNIKIPMGAGAYMATNRNNDTNIGESEFYADNVVYFKANENFMFEVNIPKVRYKVVSSTNALNALETGEVHYATPQLTNDNLTKINNLSSKGIASLQSKQLGYGYIGINAGKVTDINLRKAIMAAMNTSLAKSYYREGTADIIYWPMSTVSWAYPKDDNGNFDKDNGKEYIAVQYDREEAKSMIEDYMVAAGVSAGSSKLKIKFTIAGSNLTDHPTYLVFQEASELLNECGWDIEVVADTNALTKLSTGSLSVWAAAWGSTVDPDLYQVYHKNSTATSTLAWGYREILNNPDLYPEENAILKLLSEKIDEARETTDQDERTALYKEAMGYILSLAVEMPVYQRSVLYAYNGNVIDSSSLPTASEINPYTSPIDRIWEVKLAD